MEARRDVRRVADDEPLKIECRHFLSLVAGEGDRGKVATDGAMVVRTLEQLQLSLDAAGAARS